MGLWVRWYKFYCTMHEIIFISFDDRFVWMCVCASVYSLLRTINVRVRYDKRWAPPFYGKLHAMWDWWEYICFLFPSKYLIESVHSVFCVTLSCAVIVNLKCLNRWNWSYLRAPLFCVYIFMTTFCENYTAIRSSRMISNFKFGGQAITWNR